VYIIDCAVACRAAFTTSFESSSDIRRMSSDKILSASDIKTGLSIPALPADWKCCGSVRTNVFVIRLQQWRHCNDSGLNEGGKMALKFFHEKSDHL
jgi:hypothetical protein